MKEHGHQWLMTEVNCGWPCTDMKQVEPGDRLDDGENCMAATTRSIVAGFLRQGVGSGLFDSDSSATEPTTLLKHRWNRQKKGMHESQLDRGAQLGP